MSNRSERSNATFGASAIQSILALATLLILAWMVAFAGSDWGGGPFQTANAVRAGESFLLPVAAVVMSAVLLWLHSRWGWYLTLLINGLLESINIYHLVSGLLWKHSHSLDRDMVPNPLEVFFHAALLLPIVILFLPETRRDFLGPRPLTGDVPESKQV